MELDTTQGKDAHVTSIWFISWFGSKFILYHGFKYHPIYKIQKNNKETKFITNLKKKQNKRKLDWSRTNNTIQSQCS